MPATRRGIWAETAPPEALRDAATWRLLARCSLIALMYQSTHSAQASAAEHGELVDAIEAGDARRAVRLMAEHLGHVEAGLQAAAAPRSLAQALGVAA